jgi:tripartite-type tricarboxylate transporter receptor subunit TctC
VPKGTPPAVITRLNAELVRALSNQDVQDKFKANDMFPLPGTPQQFAQLLQSEAIRFAKVAKEAGVKAN